MKKELAHVYYYYLEPGEPLPWWVGGAAAMSAVVNGICYGLYPFAGAIAILSLVVVALIGLGLLLNPVTYFEGTYTKDNRKNLWYSYCRLPKERRREINMTPRDIKAMNKEVVQKVYKKTMEAEDAADARKKQEELTLGRGKEFLDVLESVREQERREADFLENNLKELREAGLVD